MFCGVSTTKESNIKPDGVDSNTTQENQQYL